MLLTTKIFSTKINLGAKNLIFSATGNGYQWKWKCLELDVRKWEWKWEWKPMEMKMVRVGCKKMGMEMVKQEMEMEMETIANLKAKENHGFTHDFPCYINPCKFLKMCIILQFQKLPSLHKVP